MAELVAAVRRHERIGLDTSVFIYHIEGSTSFAEPASAALYELARGAFTGLTSVLTLMEVAVKPLQLGRLDAAREYDMLLANYPNLVVADITRSAAWRGAHLRARHRLRPADALQLGVCLEHGATAFLTNDRDLRRVNELDILLLGDFIS